MTAGIPGVGIGGIFYLASALLMPMRSLVVTLTGRPADAQWPVALRQASIASGILAALAATGWLLGWIITTFIPEAATTVTGGAADPQVRSVVKVGALLLSFGTLAVVLAMVQVMRIVLPVRPTPPNAAVAQRERNRPRRMCEQVGERYLEC